MKLSAVERGTVGEREPGADGKLRQPLSPQMALTPRPPGQGVANLAPTFCGGPLYSDSRCSESWRSSRSALPLLDAENIGEAVPLFLVGRIVKHLP